MKVVTKEDETERQRILFQIATEIYEKTFNYSMDLIEQHEIDPVFHEMQDFEVISFFANLYTKLFCRGFMTMIAIKTKLMKEHGSTPNELLEEWIQGIYVFLGQNPQKATMPDAPIRKLKME